MDQDLHSRFIWDRLEEASRKAWDNRRAAADKELDDGIVAAFEERSYGRVLKLVDRYVAEGWDKRVGNRADHTAVYLAHLRADAHFGLGEFEEVIPIGSEVLSSSARVGFLHSLSFGTGPEHDSGRIL